MIYLLFSLITLFMTAIGPTYAQSPITYPIPELGNCADKTSCRIYCSDALHREACTSYGKSKGLIKAQPALQEIAASAATDLGCSSAESCKSFCDDPTNYQACDAFAKKKGVSGGYKVTKEALIGEITQQVRALLSNVCTDYASCKSYCDEPSNRLRCTEIAKQLNLKGGVVKRGPGGCTTEDTCKTYCSDPTHFNECKPYVPQTIGGTPEPFRGPGGCENEQACRLYCLQHPESCRSSPSISQQPTATLTRSSFAELRAKCALPEAERPEELKDGVTYRKICIGTPEHFSDYALYCKQYPLKCGSEGYKNFCREYPYKCGFMEDRSVPTVITRDPTPTPKTFLLPTYTPTTRPTITEQTINTIIVKPTNTPTKIPITTLSRPSPTPTRVPTNTVTIYNTQILSLTRVPTYTKTPTLEPTKAITSESSMSAGTLTNTVLTITPSVRGVSTKLGAFGILLLFLFGR